jgi:hypothetical protein
MDRLDRLSIEELRIRATRPANASSHLQTLERAELLALQQGRAEILRTARETVERWVFRVFGDHQYQPTWVGLNWGRSLGTADDRVEIARTLREAVTGLIVWDLVSDGDRTELLGAWGGLES